jgi:hypothetical protein
MDHAAKYSTGEPGEPLKRDERQPGTGNDQPSWLARETTNGPAQIVNRTATGAPSVISCAVHPWSFRK